MITITSVTFLDLFSVNYVFSDDGCVSLKEISSRSYGEVKYVPMNWFETPTIVYRGAEGCIVFIKRPCLDPNFK